jgi:glycosyltransferase involved in cell wall biosynthesis
MNILHVLSQFETNGAETYAAALADERISAGHSVTIVSDSFHTQTKADVLLHPIGKRDYPQRIKNIRFLIRLIKERHIDIINAHSRAASWVAYFATRYTGTPLLSSIHMRQHLHFSTRRMPIYGEKLIAVCEAIYDHLQTDLQYHGEHLALVRNGINLDRWEFHPNREPRKGKKIIAFVGRFSGFKGDMLLLLIEKVFPEVLRLSPDVEFHIVGGMSDREKIMNAVDRCNAQAGSRFIVVDGFSCDVAEVYRRSDLVVGSGRVAMEALACGTPVVSVGESNAVGIISEKTKRDALVTNFGDLDVRRPISPEKCTAEILTALRNPKIVTPEWGRAFIEENYNVKHIVRQLDSVIDSVFVECGSRVRSTV